MGSLDKSGISMDGITDQLLADGVQLFMDSYDSLVDNIDEKRIKLLTEEGRGSSVVHEVL